MSRLITINTAANIATVRITIVERPVGEEEGVVAVGERAVGAEKVVKGISPLLINRTERF